MKWEKTTAGKKYRRKYQSQWRKNNRDKCNATFGLWRAANREKYRYLIAKNRMKKRGLAFDISLEKYLSLTKQPCNFCGSTGIGAVDRIDSQKGYTNDNIQPLCFKCNIMKMDMTVEDFITQIEKIYRHTRY